jgi:hypothetical protein
VQLTCSHIVCQDLELQPQDDEVEWKKEVRVAGWTPPDFLAHDADNEGSVAIKFAMSLR